MGELSGKVAFITGAARGQGRAHAVKLSSMGADIIAVDLCDQIASVPYPMATPDDLAATVKLVQDNGARIIAGQADVRDRDALKTALKAGVEELGGRLDIVIANAGIAPLTTVMTSSAPASRHFSRSPVMACAVIAITGISFSASSFFITLMAS